MNRELFVHALNAFNRRQPGRPFTLELVSGGRIEVNHPESVSAGKHIITIKSSSGVNSYFEFDAVVRFIDNTGVS
jgi:hypothetical protein